MAIIIGFSLHTSGPDIILTPSTYIPGVYKRTRLSIGGALLSARLRVKIWNLILSDWIDDVKFQIV